MEGSGFLFRSRVWNEEGSTFGAGLSPSSAVWANPGDFSSDVAVIAKKANLCCEEGKPEDTKKRTSQGKWRVPISGVWIPLWVSKVLNYCTEFQFLIKGDSVGRKTFSSGFS
jgi:hypothetical protein